MVLDFKVVIKGREKADIAQYVYFLFEDTQLSRGLRKNIGDKVLRGVNYKTRSGWSDYFDGDKCCNLYVIIDIPNESALSTIAKLTDNIVSALSKEVVYPTVIHNVCMKYHK